MSSFSYEMSGVPLDDAWGRWALHPDSNVLPNFGSLAVTSYRAPGQQGETQSVLAPRDPQELALTLNFYPIDGGNVPPTESGRKQALEKNMQFFLQAIRAAAQESLGLVRLYQKHPDSTLDRIAAARIVSQSSPVIEGAFALARTTFILRVPSGVWHEPGYTVRQWSAPARSWLWAEMPVGPAGIENLQFAVRGRQDGKTSGHSIWVKNEADTGFIVRVDVPADRWLIVNCATWGYTIRTTLDWAAGKKSTKELLSWGRGTGKALTLFPSATMGMAKVGFRMPNAGTVALRGRKAYY